MNNKEYDKFNNEIHSYDANGAWVKYHYDDKNQYLGWENGQGVWVRNYYSHSWRKLIKEEYNDQTRIHILS